MRTLIIAAALGCLLAACNEHPADPGTIANPPTSGGTPADIEQRPPVHRETAEPGADPAARPTVGAEPRVDDAKITETIRRALASDPNLSGEARQIQVEVRSRIATLRGTVANSGERDRAVDDARAVSGVDHVSQDLAVEQTK